MFKNIHDVNQYNKEEKRKDEQLNSQITANYLFAIAILISIISLYIVWSK